MSNDRELTQTEAAELEFLEFLNVQLAVFAGESPDFLARQWASNFGAKHLKRLPELRAKAAQTQTPAGASSAA